MLLQLQTTETATLQEGVLGCIIAATYVNGYPSAEAYDRILDAVAGRELYLEADILKLIKGQTALRYVLEDDFLKSCCKKISEEWKRPVFTMVCHLLMDSGLTASSIAFLKTLKKELSLQQVEDIIDVLSLLHKDRSSKLLQSI